MSRIRALIASFFDAIKNLLNRSPKSDERSPVSNVPLRPAELAAPEVSTPEIDYRYYAKFDPFTLQTMVFPNGKPVGWDWNAYDKARGIDSQTSTNTGQKIEAQESRQYVSDASLDMSGFREALLTVPGKLKITSGQGFILSYAHGAQSKGYITAVANGLNIGHGPDWTLGPGDYAIDFTGEAPAVRIAVKIRPAL